MMRAATTSSAAVPLDARPPASLAPEQRARYSRHLLLPGVGLAGQERLAAARVAVVGAGGLGSPAVLYLAAAGVGTIGVIDDDVVEVSNLQRQVVHRDQDVGVAKVDSAARAVRDLNPGVQVVTHAVRLTAQNALDVLSGYDVVVDGTDNYGTRYLVSDACVLLGVPHVWASVFQFEGQVAVWWPPHGPCYRCLFPDPPQDGLVPSCAEAGVFGAVCGSVGAAQSTEALKLLLGLGEPAVGQLRMHDALAGTWDTLSVERDPACPACGPGATLRELADLPLTCARPAAPAAGPVETVDALELAALLADPPPGFRLVDVRGDDERAIVAIPGAEAIPLTSFEDGSAGALLGPDDDVVLYCKGGVRSERALRTVAPGSVARVRHLDGGVLAWVRTVDPSLPTY